MSKLANALERAQTVRVGDSVHYRGEKWTVVEILSESPRTHTYAAYRGGIIAGFRVVNARMFPGAVGCEVSATAIGWHL